MLNEYKESRRQSTAEAERIKYRGPFQYLTWGCAAQQGVFSAKNYATGCLSDKNYMTGHHN